MNPHQTAIDILWRHEADITAYAKQREYLDGPNHYSNTMRTKAQSLRSTIQLLNAKGSDGADAAEIERLRDALAEIDDVTCFDYPTMPEASRAKSHEMTREIVLRTLTSQNAPAQAPPTQNSTSK